MLQEMQEMLQWLISDTCLCPAFNLGMVQIKSVQPQAVSGQDQAALLFEELNFKFCMGTGDFPLSYCCRENI